MNKWKCVDCVRRDTDACHFLGVEDGYKYCENVLVDVDYAYDKGRADKYQEIVSEYMLLTEEQVNQIRADAIVEFVTRFEYENITDINSAKRLKPIIYEMHRLAEQMQKGAE